MTLAFTVFFRSLSRLSSPSSWAGGSIDSYSSAFFQEAYQIYIYIRKGRDEDEGEEQGDRDHFLLPSAISLGPCLRYTEEPIDRPIYKMRCLPPAVLLLLFILAPESGGGPYKSLPHHDNRGQGSSLYLFESRTYHSFLSLFFFLFLPFQHSLAYAREAAWIPFHIVHFDEFSSDRYYTPLSVVV